MKIFLRHCFLLRNIQHMGILVSLIYSLEYKCLDMLNFVPFVHIDEIITGYKFWWLKILNNFFRLQTDRPYIIESNIFIPKGHGIVPSDLFHVFFRVLYYKSLYICIYYRQSLRLGELELSPEFNLMQLSVEDFENKIQLNSTAPDCCHWHFFFSCCLIIVMPYQFSHFFCWI